MTTEVAGADFRSRLLSAFEASIAEDGYAKTTIADIVRRARTSRRTFYEHFSSKDECFMALLAEANAEQVRSIAAAVDPDAPWEQQARQAIEAWIASAESRPDLTLSWIRDGPSLGAAGRELTRESMEKFVELVTGLVDSAQFRSAGIGPVSRQRIIMLIGGLRELTAIVVENGGKMSDVTEEAVEATIALLAPR
ncbi:TetR/AcrR family transcriptional regulator [Mycolicibacterium diernhoferi]|uniref:TetR family transcriptional regulator n=1 Tax=Mycolicibacterium diernhoferi TaxID=1801 RepID=A0A1Q4HCZ9_9MYCO|nr:TetR/AcrR family transcriptional regulator [Mycolicibacterium diernhoferi]OJZ65388.1 TetR family transcriptional regulator [Mycolicibacterium diernhoferi]OPE53998.1 TetR family transcriptional regulator [Mycolicibacterium diernhoferi]PEG51123.1 TetR/AcrR family transcriptional regulator [Mycolicibacterium diernhoferi]QYL22120.1 TetR/AcrR family transcriptional regulator [Mycolicibacterium diernhoferi]